MKSIAEFSTAEQNKMAKALRDLASAKRRIAAFENLTLQQSTAYHATAEAAEAEAALWQAAADITTTNRLTPTDE